jgi:thiosulfate dehydrogenase
MTTRRRLVTGSVGALLAMLALGLATDRPREALAHKEPHTPEQLAAFQEVFMEQVKTGDLLFHGDGATEKRLNVQLTKTGMACAMCHPFASDTHPHEFPKFQEQINEFATLRDMINWCIEKPNEGVKIDPEGPAMKALEAYIYWSNKGSRLATGQH